MVPFVLIEALHDHVTAEGKTKNLLNYFGKRSKSIVLLYPQNIVLDLNISYLLLCKEGDPRKSQVMSIDKHVLYEQIGRTRVL